MEIVENELQRNQEDEENMKQEEGVETKITNLTEGFNESLKKKKKGSLEEQKQGRPYGKPNKPLRQGNPPPRATNWKKKIYTIH